MDNYKVLSSQAQSTAGATSYLDTGVSGFLPRQPLSWCCLCGLSMLRCFWPLVAWTSSHRIALCDNDDDADDDADKDNERSSSVSEKLGAILTPTPPVALLLIVL
ncbi:hypothetical protein RB213_007106, partial [Colletotrichum asianum]